MSCSPNSRSFLLSRVQGVQLPVAKFSVNNELGVVKFTPVNKNKKKHTRISDVQTTFIYSMQQSPS
jgi:hypothetical protein